MKRKIALFLTFCLASWLSANAESCLILQLRDGKTHSYVLSQQPTMTFGPGTLIMKSAEAESTFQLADIENFHFADQSSDLRAVADGERRFTYHDGVITVTGHQVPVLLTDLAGHSIHATQAGAGFTFDLKSQPKGIYLMRIGNESIKLYNR